MSRVFSTFPNWSIDKTRSRKYGLQSTFSPRPYQKSYIKDTRQGIPTKRRRSGDLGLSGSQFSLREGERVGTGLRVGRLTGIRFSTSTSKLLGSEPTQFVYQNFVFPLTPPQVVPSPVHLFLDLSFWSFFYLYSYDFRQIVVFSHLSLVFKPILLKVQVSTTRVYTVLLHRPFCQEHRNVGERSSHASSSVVTGHGDLATTPVRPFSPRFEVIFLRVY